MISISAECMLDHADFGPMVNICGPFVCKLKCKHRRKRAWYHVCLYKKECDLQNGENTICEVIKEARWHRKNFKKTMVTARFNEWERKHG